MVRIRRWRKQGAAWVGETESLNALKSPSRVPVRRDLGRHRCCSSSSARFVASGSLCTAPCRAMLPFAGILAVAAIGQTLVIQQGGLDLSVAGHLLARRGPRSSPSPAATRAICCPALIVVAPRRPRRRPPQRPRGDPLGITPLVATLGSNAIFIGVVIQVDRRLDRLQGDQELAGLHRRQDARHPDPRRARAGLRRSSSRSSSPAPSGDGASSSSARARSPPAPPASRSSATSSATYAFAGLCLRARGRAALRLPAVAAAASRQRIPAADDRRGGARRHRPRRRPRQRDRHRRSASSSSPSSNR